MSIMKDETFGPLVGIMKVNGDEEALHLMNDSDYGLVNPPVDFTAKLST
jgi:acyl-CoA reductase-like NAD-dependent aldehyde dehydrogenase